MSRHLFSYADLLRIARHVTPTRAPGKPGVEAVQIVFSINELLLDLIQAMQQATDFGPFTLPRDVVIDLERRFISTILNLGEHALLDLIEMLLPGKEDDSGEPDGPVRE